MKYSCNQQLIVFQGLHANYTVFRSFCFVHAIYNNNNNNNNNPKKNNNSIWSLRC